jgi:hypothetical protein
MYIDLVEWVKYRAAVNAPLINDNESIDIQYVESSVVQPLIISAIITAGNCSCFGVGYNAKFLYRNHLGESKWIGPIQDQVISNNNTTETRSPPQTGISKNTLDEIKRKRDSNNLSPTEALKYLEIILEQSGV